MSGEQLERSILERKEREELKAIAAAMSLEPVARTKKADLVDQILQAAGVEVAPAGDQAAPNGKAPRPRTTRSRSTKAARAAVDAAEAEAEAGSGEAAADVPPGPSPRAPARRFGYPTSPGDDTSSNGHSFAASELEEEFAFEASPAGSEGGASADEAAERSARSAGEPASAQAAQSGPARGSDAGPLTQQQPRQHRQQQPHQLGGPGNQQGDAGNRRGRRRRGRDRQERELQGGNQPEAPWQGELVPVKGLLDLRDEGYGFLRTTGYLPSAKDVYVSVSQARRFSLRRGDAIEGGCRPAGPSEKYPALLRIDTINGMTPDEARERARFEDLTPLFPDSRLRLESRSDPLNVTARIVDLISPVGKGQRSMIVSPPKAGKTTILKQIAHSIEANDPDVHLMVLLVDERPEEATDWRRSVKGEVIASTFDRPSEEHTQVSELAIERAKRLVELGRDVVIILDGITRLARAYNLAQPATGRIMSGGVDSGALYPPKKFFGAARNIEEGGSLTILATALVETGSKMDEVIFEEFKGTGNMELRLDRKLAERRIYPAIDVNASSTRHEELLFDRSQLQQVWKLRRVLNALGAEGNAAAGLELLMDKIKTTGSNDEFLAEIAKAPSPSN